MDRPAPPPNPLRRPLVWVILVIVLFLAALAVDVPISRWVHDTGLSEAMKPVLHRQNGRLWSHVLAWLVRRPGNFFFTLVLCLLWIVLKPNRWREAAIPFVAGVFSGSNWFIKWIVGRHRPYTGYGVYETHVFAGGVPGLFGREHSLSFPSGDTCLAFATAIAFGYLLPRWRPVFFVWATLVAAERIVENAHYPSDTVAGAALGIGAGCLAIHLLRPRLEQLESSDARALQNSKHPDGPTVMNEPLERRLKDRKDQTEVIDDSAQAPAREL